VDYHTLGAQAAYTNLTTFGALANAVGWLHNDGSGALAYQTPTAANIGAEPALGNPSVSGYVLSSTAAGYRSWVPQSGGGGSYPGAGIASSTGTSWSASYGIFGSGSVLLGSAPVGSAAYKATSFFEPALGNPPTNGDVLSSTTAGARSWAAAVSAVTGTAPVVATPSGSTVNVSMQDSTVTPGTYLNVAFTVSAKGLITAAGPPFSASFGCTQCGTYEIGYSGITAASGAISYANPSVPTSASVSDGTNTDTLSTPFTSWVLSHPYTSNTTFTLTTLGNGQTVTQSNGIAFVPRSYGGTGSGGATGATASGTSAALVGASGTLTNIGLGSSCAGQSFTATTSGTQYVYYLSPCNVSNPGGGSFTIPGPTVFPMNAPTSFTFTGQYGGTWGGYLYQSVNAYVSGTSYTIGVGN
jgi:hypothetical protein